MTSLATAIHDGIMSAFDARMYAAPDGCHMRNATTEDHHAIAQLWLEGVYSSTTFGRGFHPRVNVGTKSRPKRVVLELPLGGRNAFNARHAPRVMAVLARADTRIICDPEAHHRYWAFATTEGRDTVHYVMAKRQFHREKVSAEMIRALLGPMLDRPCFYSAELSDMKREDVRTQGLEIPDDWLFDPYGLSDGRMSE